MKYPRIHSLSTINLIYHQNYDYDFHPFRTDFTGDSGVGKSLIADLLQLILVGSDEFKSATLSDGVRLPRTMVFQRPNKGVDMGYAFLNIEKSHNQFIVIGIYIQNNEDHAKSFIIQQGQEFNSTHNNSLIPFDKPVSYESLIQGNNILSFEECKKYLLEKYMYIEHIGHKNFFNILSKNSILPIESENYKESVKIYGEIIRTFARGSKISFSKDYDLKRFLFGEEGKNEILKQFESAEKEINESISTHESIIKDIDNINKNLKDLKSLLKLKNESDENYIKWVKAKIGFCIFQENEAQKLLGGNAQQIVNILNNLNLFNQFIASESTLLEEEQGLLEKKLRNFEKISQDFQHLQKLKKWLNFYSENNPENLKKRYAEHTENKKIQNQITQLNQLLLTNKIERDFEKSKWIDGFETGFEWNHSQIETLEKELKNMKAFEAFSDLENKESLAYWAVNNFTSFTREQESILMYFKTLSIQKQVNPKEKDRFSNNPKSFLEKPIIEFIEEDGFYLNLGGVNEYILYDKELRLSSGNIIKIRDFFAELNTSIKKEINNIETTLPKLKTLFEVLKSIPEFVNAYQNNLKVINFKFNSDFDDISEKELDEIIKTHTNQKQIEEDFNSNNVSSQRSQAISKELPNVKALIISVNKILKDKDAYELKAKEYSVVLPSIQNLSKPDFGKSFAEWESYFNSIKISSLENYESIINDCINKNKISEQVKIEFKNTNIDFDQTDFYANSPDSLEKKYTESTIFYESKFKVIAERELQELDYLKAISSYDFVELGREIYPDIFNDLKNLEDKDVIEVITNSLNEIAEKSREFARTKSNKLRTILENLIEKIETYKTLQKQIQSFFKTQKQKGNLISNEFEVKLSLDDGDLGQKWIIEALNFEDYNDFEKIISFKDFILEVFRRMSENDLTKDLTIEKILNPNSYFRLNFKMTKNDGWDNLGISNGQNYAMVALLCIARLSIIEKQNFNKNKQEKGIRFMPIDEAEGLGSNFDLLYKIAKNMDYQIITMSIGTVDFLEEGSQTIYILHRNLEEKQRPVNYPPERISNNLIEEDEIPKMEIFEGFE